MLGTPGFHGEVRFTLVNGTVEYPEIVTSTGDAKMDELMLRQVASAHPPKTAGPTADESHEFILELEMPTTLELSEDSMRPGPFPVAPSPHEVTGPYWADALWQISLLDAVQSVVRAPADMLGTPSLRGEVRFMLVNDAIEHPGIVASTGTAELDELMLRQVASAQAPKTVGPQAHDPHEFVLELDMPTTLELFEGSVYEAIDREKVYPKEPIIEGAVGGSTVDFDYRDSKAENIILTESSKHRSLDKSSINAVTRANLPQPPPGYGGKSIHMQVIICYSINGSKNCPKGKNVIHVEGWRLLRRG